MVDIVNSINAANDSIKHFVAGMIPNVDFKLFEDEVDKDSGTKSVIDVLNKTYEVKVFLGQGSSAKVYLIQNRESEKQYACKFIEKNRQFNDTESMKTELNIMKRVKHPNIISLSQIYESSECMW